VSVQFKTLLCRGVSQIPLERLVGNKLAASPSTGKLRGNVCNGFGAYYPASKQSGVYACIVRIAHTPCNRPSRIVAQTAHSHILLNEKLPVWHFYSAMHYSAKRGFAIACRLSVCPSVFDVGGSGSHRLEILETNCTDKKAQHLRSS